MTEYIERDKALEDFDAWIESTGALPKGTSYYYECRGCIEEVPAADVEPVRHGRWLLARPGEWTAVMECSECGRRISIDPKGVDLEKEYPYCHCGAKMGI